MKVPRDISGDEFIRALSVLGYVPLRQEGSHMRLICRERGVHHISVPRHKSLHVGTFSYLLGLVGKHHGLTRDELLRRLFG